MAKELEKTLLVDNEEYNINATKAETADKVAHTLTLKKTNLTDGSASKNEDNWTVFDGSADKILDIVPASGGGFSGKITVPQHTTSISARDVVNYGDIQRLVVPKLINTSVLYTWNGENIEATLGENNTEISCISVVKGDDNLVNSFAEYNCEKKVLVSYLYIGDDTGNLYFGTYNDTTVIKLATTTKSCTMKVDLASEAGQKFDGTQNKLTLGVTGTLPIKHGGTGAANAAEAIENLITNDTTLKPRSIEVGAYRWALPTPTNPLDYVTYRTTDENTADGGIELNNSDIVNINGMWFAEKTNAKGEGLMFLYRDGATLPFKLDATNDKWDRIYAADGNVYLVKQESHLSDGATCKLFNSSDVIPVANGGTGKTSLSAVHVGSAKSASVHIVTQDGTIAEQFTKARIIRSSRAPRDEDGADGDIWITYSV